jgi:hypothetical protein
VRLRERFCFARVFIGPSDQHDHGTARGGLVI